MDGQIANTLAALHLAFHEARGGDYSTIVDLTVEDAGRRLFGKG